MHAHRIEEFAYDHAFGQDVSRPEQRKLTIVLVVTTLVMAVEIVAGITYGSVALLADGLHMASDAAALGISIFAYAFARRRCHDRAFSFGTGKVHALAGFSSALLLGVFALGMAWEAALRLIAPVPIAFAEAVTVATLGFVVNAACALFLGHGHHDHGHHDHGHEGHSHHEHDREDHGHIHDHDHGHDQSYDHGHRRRDHGHHGQEQAHGDAVDHNYQAARLHVLADAVTSLAAIAALLGAWLLGWTWLDPLIGLVAAAKLVQWSWRLIGGSASVLLDREAPETMRRAVISAVESGDSRVADLHLWSVAPGRWTVILSVVSHEPLPPEAYKARLPAHLGIEHPIVEVRRCCAA